MHSHITSATCSELRMKHDISHKSHGSNKYAKVWIQANEMHQETSLLSETAYLQELEQASTFSEQARHLNAYYHYPLKPTIRDTDVHTNTGNVSWAKSE